MLHPLQNAQGNEVLAASEVIDLDSSTAIVIASSVNGEGNAELITAAAREQHSIASTDEVIVFWSTPAFASVTDKALLRRLFTHGSSLEWGPDLLLTDAPQVHAAAERCNAEVEAAAS